MRKKFKKLLLILLMVFLWIPSINVKGQEENNPIDTVEIVSEETTETVDIPTQVEESPIEEPELQQTDVEVIVDTEMPLTSETTSEPLSEETIPEIEPVNVEPQALSSDNIILSITPKEKMMMGHQRPII